MDFQPRLGVITRSLRLALPDLLHFALVAGAVFLGHAMMAFLIFGSAVPEFSGFGASVATCFSMLLGDAGDVPARLGALGGVQGAAGVLFFVAFELVVFLVMLNLLLAIIVDAFATVSGRAEPGVDCVGGLSAVVCGWRREGGGAACAPTQHCSPLPTTADHHRHCACTTAPPSNIDIDIRSRSAPVSRPACTPSSRASRPTAGAR